ncbi:MAG: DUF3108 domain-containing protein [Sphingobacteriaceae bacterium]
MKSLLLSFLLIFLFVSGTLAQELFNKKEPVFQQGEQLNYKLRYGLFTAAEAKLTVEAGDTRLQNIPVYHIVVEGSTAGTFDVFYKVRNRYESYVDRNTLEPYFYKENRHEGRYRRNDKVTFNQNEKKIIAEKGTYKFNGKVFDFVSAYYFARSLDISKMNIGDEFKLQYFLDDTVSNLGITYVGKEKVKSAIGTFNCLKFNPTITPGRIFRKDSKLYLWVTDDGNRIPVKAEVEILIGSVTMDLTEAKGLKYLLNPIRN